MSKAKLVQIIIIQILLFVFFEITLKLFLLQLVVVVLDIIFYKAERNSKNLNFLRSLSLVIYFLIFGLFSNIFIPSGFNNFFNSVIYASKDFSYISAGLIRIDWFKFNLILFGILLLLNETNLLIRYFFDKYNLTPKIENAETKVLDNKEYNTGRIIGMLERILIFLFILANQYAAIGFIIAAKGFTRFRELDNRDFAEYVLTGTLLSSLSALGISLIIKSML